MTMQISLAILPTLQLFAAVALPHLQAAQAAAPARPGVPMPTAAELEARFLNPPPETRPWVYWFWMNGNVTREGITADLEAMHRIGIGGALIMGVGLRTPPGEADFNTPLWHELYSHAAKECLRLGMKMTLHQCDGWATAGGQWITPDRSMKKLVWTSTHITGPSDKPLQLPKPEVKEDFYEEVAVLAVPMDSAKPVKPAKALVDGKPAPELTDGRPGAGARLPGDFIELVFDEPQKVGSMVFHLPKINYSLARNMPSSVELSSDGKTFHTAAEFDLNVSLNDAPSQTLTLSFPPENVAAIRVRVATPNADGEIAEIETFGEQRVHLWEVKSGFAREREHGGETPWIDLASSPAEAAGIPKDSVIDLSGKMAADGALDWKAPEGSWQILRIGMTSTAKQVAPRTRAGGGLEADKMSGEAIRFHWDSFAKKVIAANNVAPGNPIYSVHTDSWEANLHTWSNEFQTEFEKRRGYSMTPWLPALATGRIIGTAEESERFLWDARRTMADLIADNFYSEMRRLSHESGVLYQGQSAGRQMFMYDPLNYAARTDIRVGEFWMPEEARVDCKIASSIANTYDRPIAAAEAFTSGHGGFRDAPFDFKAIGDHAFATGINRFIIHRYAMQPFIGVEPGITFGPWGINFERTVTWWENGGKAWVEYLTRCQAMLQSGRFVGDVIYFIGDGAPNFLGHRHQIWNPIPPGHDFDGCNLEILERLTVAENGDLVLPHGPRYRVLLLPHREQMTLPAIRAVERLVEAGATAVGPRPLRTPGLKDWRENDAELQRIAGRVWGDVDGKAVTENRFGKGRVIYGVSLADVLAGITPPDFDYSAAEGVMLRYIHRRTEDANFYFVANSNRHASADAVARFRVTGKAPEFWDPSTATIARPLVYRQEGGVTAVPLHLGPAGSVFVVFREPANPEAIVALSCGGQQVFPAPATAGQSASGALIAPQFAQVKDELRLLAGEAGDYAATTAAGKQMELVVSPPVTLREITGPWNLSFPPERGAPEKAVFPTLISWPDSADPGIKYFSGTATYTTTFQIDETPGGPAMLDLGDVKNIAEVSLNKQDLGILWKPPYSVEVTGALKAGENTLEVKVTNLWPNRLIGDEKLHPDPSLNYSEQGPSWSAGGPIRAIPDWVKTGGKSPVGRSTFALWRFYDGSEELLPSGLLGPVRIETRAISRVR